MKADLLIFSMGFMPPKIQYNWPDYYFLSGL